MKVIQRLLPIAVLAVAVLAMAGCTIVPSQSGIPTKDQVTATERAFAATMAKRDLVAFATFIDEEAVFFSGTEPLRGKQAVIDWWARFYKDPQAPFSWEPDQVEVLASGTLALSSGPVRDPAGNLTNRFNSIWRRTPSGDWKIIFDKGSPLPRENSQ